MNINTTTFKLGIGSLALVSACAFLNQAFADNQTYTCITTYNATGVSSTFGNTKDVQASSATDAKNKTTAEFNSKNLTVLNMNCTLKQ